MAIGIRNFFDKTATQIVTNSVAPVDMTSVIVPIAANQRVHCEWWVPFSLAATGGFRFLLASPAAPAAILATLRVDDCTTANTFYETVQTAYAAFTNASAVAGNYVAKIVLSLTNGLTPGNVSLQYAQNNAQANNFTVLGAVCEVIYL